MNAKAVKEMFEIGLVQKITKIGFGLPQAKDGNYISHCMLNNELFSILVSKHPAYICDDNFFTQGYYNIDFDNTEDKYTIEELEIFVAECVNKCGIVTGTEYLKREKAGRLYGQYNDRPTKVEREHAAELKSRYGTGR
jgi:hypothetical protein